MREKFIKAKSDKLVLVSNIGSSSRKYILYLVNVDNKEPRELLVMDFDREVHNPDTPLDQAFYKLLETIAAKYNFGLEHLDVILERVVAVGEYFLRDILIDQKYLIALEQAKRYDTLHTDDLLNELNQIFVLRKSVKQTGKSCKFKLVGISDSAFHSTIPREVYIYALTKSDQQKDLRRFGYHGISMSEVANRLSPKYKNILAVHLGGGGSVTAIENGKSIYNSFGMTPVSGIINLTRSGSIDPIAVLDILRSKRKRFFMRGLESVLEEIKVDLYEKSGLLALTGEFDMRKILGNLKSRNQKLRAKNEFALKVYLERINEYLGSAYARLGKIDVLVLTGPILGNATFRKLFLEKIKWLKVRKSNIKIIETEEEHEMLRLAKSGGFL